MPASVQNRNQLLQMTDKELLQHCRVDTMRGSGKGGQKRNRTNSAIRVSLENTHEQFTAYSDRTRSQHKNRELALRALRHEIALWWREKTETLPCDVFQKPPNVKNADYPLWAARLLDTMEECDYSLRDTTEVAGISTNRLVKFLFRDPALWEKINRERAQRNMSHLKKPR